MGSQANDGDNTPDRRIAFFDHHAATWDGEHDAGPAIRRMETLQDKIALAPGCNVLEVGCGTGALTGWLAEAVRPGQVTGIDFAPGMISQATAKGLRATFRCLDVCTDDLGEARYDVALCFHSFPHFRDPAAALRNLARSLKPSGRLAVIHLRGSQQINAFHASVGGAVCGDRLPRGKQWDALLAQAGLARRTLDDDDGGFFLLARRAAVDGR